MIDLSVPVRIFAREVDEPLLQALRALPEREFFLETSLLDADPQAAIENLAAEYCRLFVLPHAPCSPYVGAGTTPLLGGRAQRALAELVDRYQLEILAPLPPDHVAVLLELLGSVEPADRVRLLGAHSAWLRSFLGAVREASVIRLYAAVAELALAVIDEFEADRSSTSGSSTP